MVAKFCQRAFSASIEIIIWFLSFNLLIWCMTLIDLGAVAGRSNPSPEARGGGREDQPHVQGAMASRAQEGLEELSHIEGQEG